MTPRFVIFIETVTGDVVKAFTWTRDLASGLARAKQESQTYGFGSLRIRSEAVDPQ